MKRLQHRLARGFKLARRFKRLSPLLVAPAVLLLSQGQAKAILNIRIFDSGPNLGVRVEGVLNQLPTSKGSATCGISGALVGEFSGTPFSAAICAGNDESLDFYSISSVSAGFGGTGFLIPADSVSGPGFAFAASAYSNDAFYVNTVGMPAGYALGANYFSSATFNGTNLANEGFTTTGLVGTWTLDGTTESINVYVGPVPGPLPLLGAGAAFGWSRRLRRRIASSGMTSPEA